MVIQNRTENIINTVKPNSKMEYSSKSCLSELFTHLSIGILNSLKHELPLSILKTIYNTLFMPNLNYRILVWGSETESIHKLQKRVLRIISDSKFNAHTELICREQQLLLRYKLIFTLNNTSTTIIKKASSQSLKNV